MRTPFQSLIIAAVVLCLVGGMGAAPTIAPAQTLPPQATGPLTFVDIDVSNVSSIGIETSGYFPPAAPQFPPGLAQTPRVVLTYRYPRGDLKFYFYLTRSSDQQCYQMALTATALRRTGSSLSFVYGGESVVAPGPGPHPEVAGILRTLVGCSLR